MGSRNVEAAWDEGVGGGGGGEDSPSGTEQRERIVFIYILEEGKEGVTILKCTAALVVVHWSGVGRCRMLVRRLIKLKSIDSVFC